MDCARAARAPPGAVSRALRLVGFVFGRRGGFRRGQVAVAARHDLDARALAARRHADRLRLVGALLGARGALLVGARAADLLAEHAGVGDLAREQLERADGVVVAGDRVVDEIGVAVRVDDGDDRDLELARLGDGDVLLDDVDDEDGARQLRHALDAAEGPLELLALARDPEDLLLRHALEGAVGRHLLDGVQAVDRALDGVEVRERAAQPAVRHAELAAAQRLVAHDLLGLLLRADEQHRAARRDGLDEEVVGALELPHRLLQVDDVDAVARAEDVGLHFRVPALRLVAEVDAGLHHLWIVIGWLRMVWSSVLLLLVWVWVSMEVPSRYFPPPASS